MSRDTNRASRDLFRWRSTIPLIVLAISALALFHQYAAAGGVALGLSLYAVNLFLLMEIGRSLLRGGGRPRPLAALSSAGRLLFQAIALSSIGVFLGREVLLGACGGFLIAQVNLHVPRTGHKREE
jgi:hypothetical protein